MRIYKMISILLEIRRWSDQQTAENRSNKYTPLAISHAFERQSNILNRMIPSKPGGLSDKEMKGIKHSELFMNKAVKFTKKARKQLDSKYGRTDYPPYIGPERRKANLPRFRKKAA